MSDNSSKILRFWRNIEIFNLPDLDKDAVPLSELEQLPWERIQKPGDDIKKLRHILYIGKVSKKDIIGYLRNVTGEKEEDWLEPVFGHACLAVIILDEQGRPDANSYVQASYIQGINCISQNKSLEKINELLSGVQGEFEKRFNIAARNHNIDSDEERKGDIVTREVLLKEIGILKDVVGSSFLFGEDVFHIEKKVYPDSDNEPIILNSFYLDDLNYLMNSSNYGKALEEYLSQQENKAARKDIIANKMELLKCLDPALLSPGRWPSPFTFGLYTAQQGAVNSVLSDLKHGAGIRGINGPPGTGKTTLLQDVIADIIVSRAELLVDTGVTGILGKGKMITTEKNDKYYYYNIEDEKLFEGYGIVVTSNNNGAVENISKELPSLDKLDKSLVEEAGYFKGCAARLLSGNGCWGVLSAALGNNKNKRIFRKDFWESLEEQFGFNECLLGVYKNENYDNTSFYQEEYDRVKEELKELLNKFRDFQNDAALFHAETLPPDSQNEQGLLKSFIGRISVKTRRAVPTADELMNKYGLNETNLINQQFINKDLKKIHLSTPYSSLLINELRSLIFLRSLELHQFAILANAKKFRNSIHLFMDMLSGKIAVTDEVCVTLWKTFFFCVPVVSTSLASAGRLFKQLGKESIGWLLFDEAGQATPQSGAGVIWRSRRCIIVGDPLQVKPVVTHPEMLIGLLRKDSGVEEAFWSPLASSVQSLADRVSNRGTYLGEEDTKQWAGFPLRTHRRCENPMFNIANKIAYEKQMVKASEDEPFKCILGKSVWYNIEGKILAGKHGLQEEIQLLKLKIDMLFKSGYDKEIYVITPFTSVKFACESILKDYTGENKRKKNGIKVKCGTIHTFQGKEAEIVFLVLGSNPNKAGAREWVTESPNMINVALTRARRRFYMIGSKKNWGHLNFINQFDGLLPVVDIKPEELNHQGDIW